MNAFETAGKNNKTADLQRELEDLFNSQNKSLTTNTVSIPASYLRVIIMR